jgi:hypothetical protein
VSSTAIRLLPLGSEGGARPPRAASSPGSSRSGRWLPRLCNSLGEALEASIGRGSLRRRGAVDVVRRSHGRPSGKYKRIFDHLILCSDGVDVHKITSAVPRQSSRA